MQIRAQWPYSIYPLTLINLNQGCRCICICIKCIYRLYIYIYIYKPNLYILYMVYLAYLSSKPLQTCPGYLPHLLVVTPLPTFRTNQSTHSFRAATISRNLLDNPGERFERRGSSWATSNSSSASTASSWIGSDSSFSSSLT